MKSSDLLRLVDQMHHDKNIKRDVIFDGIEAALQLAAQKHFGEEEGVVVNIDRDSGEIIVLRNGEVVDPALLGRIPAQSAKNVMIQKIREAESNAVFNEFTARRGDLITGSVKRHEAGSAIVEIGKTEAILPRSEQIPGETYHVNDKVKAVILDVKRAGQKVKIILSREHPDFVRRLFEEEIPEIQERIIEIKAIAREAGYRTKIAVSSIDLKVDCVGACVGVRGSRIKNIVDELGGERIDIVRWNDSLQVMIPNALQPAQVEEVFLYPRPGRAIILVQEDQLSLAIGRRGQNVRLASKLVGWDIEIMTHDELNESIEKALQWFLAVPGVSEEMAERFIEEGFMSYDDLALCDAESLVEILDPDIPLELELADEIVDFCEDAAEKMERGIDVSAPPGGEPLEAAGEDGGYAGEEGGLASETVYAPADGSEDGAAGAEFGESGAGEEGDEEYAGEAADETPSDAAYADEAPPDVAYADGDATTSEPQAQDGEPADVSEPGGAPDESAPTDEAGQESPEGRRQEQPYVS